VRRLFWLALGATLGVLIVRKLTRTAQALTPSGIAGSLSDSLASLTEYVRDFADDVREAMHDREAELLEGSGLDGRLGAKPEDF
jgi:hypothetical protein